MRRLRRLLSLSPRQWAGLVQAYWLLLRARLWSLIHRDALGLPIAALGSSLQHPPLTPVQQRVVAEGVRLVDIASRYPFRWALCLPRSLALLWWLKARGIQADLRIGVRKEGQELIAHAWVEYQGRVLNDAPWVASYYLPLTPARSPSGPRPSDKAKEPGP